ncbi:hypothetical protein LHJ74_02520 [Streptomyces sp. N2-109]|uniref:Integral membrane protein n=1 Tax=Streptomyces gossypii TaxID=2883101 RepID=A0ABT2JN65_9ACTN|nr:hypothetical protein [Streptomyces gossypii]MCT2588820.1 hypothetical protein [Streptomyces gossypii]
MKALRKAVRWSFAAVVPGELVLVVCLVSGAGMAPAARIAVELAVLVVMVASATLLALDCHHHRRGGMGWRQAVLAAVADSVPVSVRRLIAHELRLSTSFLRWITRHGPHGVREGDTAVAYASGQAAVRYGFLFVCVVETVALAYLIPWPVVHAIVLVLDVWGVYFIIALHASCVVRPHVIGADGALWLRYGVLLDIRIPAEHIASARVERRFPESRLAAVDEDGGADLAVGAQTTVTVQLTEPVSYTRPLGKPAQARTFRYYAEDPASAVAELRARAAFDGT